MKKIQLVVVLLISAILLSAWTPSPMGSGHSIYKVAAASATIPVKFEISNKTEANVYISLEGPLAYYFIAPPGKMKVDMLKGTYQYSYWACGVNKTGTLVIKKANQQLTIPACSAAGKAQKTVKFAIINKTGTALTVYLSGPANFTVAAKPGKTKIDLPQGKYQYSYRTDCKGYKSGNIKIEKFSYLYIPACVSAISDKLIKVMIFNETSGMLTLTLDGLADFTFYFPVGTMKIDILKGQYKFTAYGCGDSKSGTIKLTPGFKWYWTCSGGGW